MSPFRCSVTLAAALVLLLSASPVPPADAGAPAPGLPGTPTPEAFLDWVKGVRTSEAFRPEASGRVVARFSSEDDAARTARDEGWRILDHLDGRGTVVLGVPEHSSARSFARSLARRSEVRFAEPDGIVRPLGQVTDWGSVAIRAPEAHAAGTSGAGVVVAVVDSGVDYTHEDLAASIWRNAGEIGGNGRDDDGNGFVDDVRGWDFIGKFFTSTEEDSDPMDVLGHGTHVAGIVAARDNSVGVVGVAPGATIMPVRVLDDFGSGFDSTIANGIRYAAANGAAIINMSLGGLQRSTLMREAVEYAIARGVAVVAAAGNEFLYSIPSYPAGYPSVISVAASRERHPLEKTFWSNWGNVDFLAPGENVLSTTPDGAYSRFSGTSMASPHVAGALALVKQRHPGFSPAQLEQALAATARDVSFPGKDDVTGSGVPDAAAASGTLPAVQLELYRSAAVIPSDGETPCAVTLRLLDSAGSPVAGRAGTFAATAGSLSASSFVTDAAGEARTALTVDDAFGIATVTGTVAGEAPRALRVIVEDDRVRVDDVRVTSPPGAPVAPGADAAGGEAPPATPTQPLRPGSDAVVRVFLGNHRFDDPKRAGARFSVTGPDGAPVPELAGQIEPVPVGSGFFGLWFSQVEAISPLLRVPESAAPGRYLLRVTATTERTGETHTFTAPFWIGVRPAVLVVRSPVSFNTETFNFADFGNPKLDWGYRKLLDDAGLPFAIWDLEGSGPPPPEELLRSAAVIWLGGIAADLALPSIEGYLRGGGNLWLAAESYATADRANPSAVHRDLLHATGVSALGFPDEENHQIYPASVRGLAGGPFAGVTLGVDSTDIASAGEGTAIFNDELVAYAGDGTTPAFAWPSGVHSPALAGIYTDDGSFRALYTSFGLEAIDDRTSTRTRAQVLGDIIALLAPAPRISGVSPASLSTAGGRFTISGADFQPTGRTVVRVGRRYVVSRVVDRHTIVVRLPAGFGSGLYGITVVNPIGGRAYRSRALRVVRAS